jgi:hypothetical protein
MGEVFAGRYELVDPIGRGGVGAVWRAWDHRRRRYVAAKVLQQSDAHSLLRFVREQALRIDHPHVLAPASWAADDDKVLFTMDLVGGGSLVHLIGDYGPLPPAFVCTLLDQLLSGLAAVHAEDVVHRDIKPANILLEATGTSRPRLRLSDFGIAMRLGEPRLTETNLVVGTPGYISPEQMLGSEPDFPADLFAVGLVALYLLEGAKPDAKALVQYFAAHGTPSAPKGIPEPLWQVVATLVQPDPQARFRTATGARKALAAAVELLPEPGPDDELIEIFDQLGPLPPGFGPQGPLRGAPGVGSGALGAPGAPLGAPGASGPGVRSGAPEAAGAGGQFGAQGAAGTGAQAGAHGTAGLGGQADAQGAVGPGMRAGSFGPPEAGVQAQAGFSGPAGGGEGVGSWRGGEASPPGSGPGSGPVGSGPAGSGPVTGSPPPTQDGSTAGISARPAAQDHDSASVWPGTDSVPIDPRRSPDPGVIPADPRQGTGPVPSASPYDPLASSQAPGAVQPPSMSDTGSFHLPPPQATASTPHPRHPDAQAPTQTQQGKQHQPARVSPHDPTHVLPSPRTQAPPYPTPPPTPPPHHRDDASTASYTAQVPQVPHPPQEISRHRAGRATRRARRRPGPPAKVVVPVVLLALACYAVGFWALVQL